MSEGTKCAHLSVPVFRLCDKEITNALQAYTVQENGKSCKKDREFSWILSKGKACQTRLLLCAFSRREVEAQAPSGAIFPFSSFAEW